ncbi:hypothetical protein [Mucilaginibacter sp.]|uniref:hypothetical protein n=1 Tax=Mucilaginibacter sp. TaxID=1882438 RepID=UPI00284239A9|nr:hypothetical protein [Mucilaginibacter sp.]MDR3695311.1 hypothetical protein [Mucilaginibacter sp.]
MSIGLRIRYSQMFDEPRPDISSLFQDYSSRDIIGSLAMISDKLLTDGTSKKTQIELLRDISTDYQPELREKVFARAVPLIMDGYVLFALPYIVELVNREFSNFRVLDEAELPEYEGLNMLKAIIAVSDEMTELDTLLYKDTIEAAKLGGDNLIKLLWPHLIKQFEFSNEPNAVLECYKGMAFIFYLERHPKFGSIAKSYFENLECSCGLDYLHRIISIVTEYVKRDQNNNDNYFFNVKVSTYEPVLEALVIDPKEIHDNPAKQFDYRGLKEKPILKIAENHYIIPYWHYLLNAPFNGLIFSFYRNSKIGSLFNPLSKEGSHIDGQDQGLGKFKGVVGKEFSEDVLFKNTIKTCFNRKHETLLFFEDYEKFNPDCYYRKGNHIFIIEFKDYLLSSEVIQSNSYEKIKEEIDKKFVSYTVEANGKEKVKEKGISQLARHIELLAADQELFWKLDVKAANQKLNLKKMNIYPVIIQTNIYFDIPGINDYLNQILQRRLAPTGENFRSVKPFTMINFQYFFDRLLLFANSRLELNQELDYYHHRIDILKRKTQKSFSEEDWFKSLMPFSSFNSENFKRNFEYRRDDLLNEIRNCWLVND